MFNTGKDDEDYIISIFMVQVTMEVAFPSKTLVLTYQTTSWCHNSEAHKQNDHVLHSLNEYSS
jgi:hypothetical protein